MRRLTPVLAVLLALALLAAQTLGLVHRSFHGGVPAQSLPHVHGQASAPIKSSKLFGGHEAGTAECRLIDALGHAAPPAAPVLALPLVLTPFVLAWHQGECLARWIALFDARGPPLRS